MGKSVEKKPSQDDAVFVALSAAYKRAKQVGRTLHPYEARWAVRAAFRVRFPNLSFSLVDHYADVTIKAIREMAELEGVGE